MNKEFSSLPIFPYLDEICAKLKSSYSRSLVLTAETAAGKSSAVPLALLRHFSGKILMLEPRRIAVTAIADRISYLLGEKTGETVGYRLHLDSKISSKTRLEIITEAILTRKLQNDPLLEDVNVIILDEFHERSIHSDLALAFLKESMQLRKDLFIMVMSATINYRSLTEYLGSKENPAPFMQIPGRQFPVEIEYRSDCSVAEVIFEELQTNDSNKTISKKTERTDTILAFLPGIREIKKTKIELESKLTNDNFIEILILHSSIPLNEQRKILRPCPANSPRRVILSSAIAETSLTVPGVTIVIDSGLCRVNKMNINLGMEHLVTEKESLFSAEQRTGRAGRVMQGKCIRLWNKHEPRIEQSPPEILRADLTGLVLDCAEWGTVEIEKFDWLTPPSENAWNAAKSLLENLDCLEIQPESKSVKITKKGRAALRLGLHPRLACVALAGGAESILPFSEYAEANTEKQKIFLDDLKRRLSSVQKEFFNSSDLREIQSDKISPLLAGFPDRLAKKSLETPPNSEHAEYQFPSGRKAWLTRENLISLAQIPDFPNWLVAPEVDAGEQTGKIYSFEILSDYQTETFLQKHSKSKIKTEFIGLTNVNDLKNLSIQKKEITTYGAIILKEKKVPIVNEDFSLAICDLVQKKGLKILPLDSKTQDFLLRVEFFGSKKLNSLSENSEKWLQPFVKSQKLNAQDIFNALYWYLDGQEIDSKVPIQITLPNGRKRKIKYEKKSNGEIQPTLEIIIQQIFGCFKTPKILGKPVLLKLLSPANRPLQITDDLENFWKTSWPQICKEMKGRYPKHNWDYRISE